MGTTNAERQAAFRARKIKAEDGNGSRLDLVIDTSTHLALKRLAKHYGVSVVALLAQLAKGEQGRVLDEMDGEQQTAYYDAVTG